MEAAAAKDSLITPRTNLGIKKLRTVLPPTRHAAEPMAAGRSKKKLQDELREEVMSYDDLLSSPPPPSRSTLRDAAMRMIRGEHVEETSEGLNPSANAIYLQACKKAQLVPNKRVQVREEIVSVLEV